MVRPTDPPDCVPWPATRSSDSSRIRRRFAGPRRPDRPRRRSAHDRHGRRPGTLAPARRPSSHRRSPPGRRTGRRHPASSGRGAPSQRGSPSSWASRSADRGLRRARRPATPAPTPGSGSSPPGSCSRRLQREADLPGPAAVVLDGSTSASRLRPHPGVLVEVRPTCDRTWWSSRCPPRSRPDAPRRSSAVRLSAPVVAVPGSLHPVVEVWCPPAPGVRRPTTRSDAVPRPIAGCVRRALGRAGRRRAGLPAQGCPRCQASRHGWPRVDADVHRCTGGCRTTTRTSRWPRAAPQGRGPRPPWRSPPDRPRRPGVVDAGLSRQLRRPPPRPRRTGDGERQPRGRRATRRARRPGEHRARVYRCWSQAAHATCPPTRNRRSRFSGSPASFALEIATWGNPDRRASLMDQPPAAMAAARTTLSGLGTVADDGSVTEQGRAIARVNPDRARQGAARRRRGRRLPAGARRIVALSRDGRGPPAPTSAPAFAASVAVVLRRAAWSESGGGLEAAVRSVDRLWGAGDDRRRRRRTRRCVAHPDRIAWFCGRCGTALPDDLGHWRRPRSRLGADRLPWLAVADADRQPGTGTLTDPRAPHPLSEDPGAGGRLPRGGRR